MLAEDMKSALARVWEKTAHGSGCGSRSLRPCAHSFNLPLRYSLSPAPAPAVCGWSRERETFPYIGQQAHSTFLLGVHVLRKGTSRSRQTHREAFERRPARRARDKHWLCEELLMDVPRAPTPPVHGRVQVSPQGLFYIGARPCCDRV